MFNFPVANGVATGTMTVPVGSDRHFRIAAFDAAAVETEQADTTITVQSGSNPYVNAPDRLAAHRGDDFGSSDCRSAGRYDHDRR